MSLANRPSTTGGVSDVIGIDLGTTNSVVAMMRYGHVEVIPSGEGLLSWFKLSSVAHISQLKRVKFTKNLRKSQIIQRYLKSGPNRCKWQCFHQVFESENGNGSF
jgi:molecular chaperone DnaK (HSP70)